MLNKFNETKEWVTLESIKVYAKELEMKSIPSMTIGVASTSGSLSW